MDMKITKRDAALLIGLGGILIAVAVYYFVYMPLGDKQRALEAENVTLQQRVDDLQTMANNKEFYASEIERMTNENNALMDQFPADVREEDMVMQAVGLQATAPWESVSVISIGTAEERYVLGQKQAEADAAAAQTDATASTDGTAPDAASTPADSNTVAVAGTDTVVKKMLRKQVGITYQADYEGFKSGMKEIASQGNRETIEDVTAVYDIESGILASTVKVNMHYITGTDKTYTPPQIPYIQQGTDNIFGTISLINTSEDQASTEEETE